ncbi:MAG TPA: biopolymer transporter ExbD [Luteibaculaceae bacterium]|nr:biopolymer transporter ExbD [Luteibaculaceae bacterium]
MAQMNTDEAGGGGGKGKHQKKRAKKSSTNVDMTPMVDLAFLLLTFFMLATTFSKPKTLEITFPKDAENKEQKVKIPDELATTFLIGEETDEVYYYNGKFQPDTTKFQKLSLAKDGIRKFLLNKNRDIDNEIKELEKKFKAGQLADSTFTRLRSAAKGKITAPFVIVKTCKLSKYKTVIDVIDELNICNVGKYAVVDMSDAELYPFYQIVKPELVGGAAASPTASTN